MMSCIYLVTVESSQQYTFAHWPYGAASFGGAFPAGFAGAPGPNEALPSGNAAGGGAPIPAGGALRVWRSRNCLQRSGEDLNRQKTINLKKSLVTSKLFKKPSFRYTVGWPLFLNCDSDMKVHLRLQFKSKPDRWEFYHCGASVVKRRPCCPDCGRGLPAGLSVMKPSPDTPVAQCSDQRERLMLPSGPKNLAQEDKLLYGFNTSEVFKSCFCSENMNATLNATLKHQTRTNFASDKAGTSKI